MKPVFFYPVFSLLLTCHACAPARPPEGASLLAPVTIITADCRNDPAIKRLVMQLLRQARVSDWIIRDNGAYQDIEARYSVLTDRQAADIVEQLKQTAGVLNVGIKKDNIPLKNY